MCEGILCWLLYINYRYFVLIVYGYRLTVGAMYTLLLLCVVDCGPPVAPQRGPLKSYTDTTDGSEVFYSCNRGLVPEGRIRTVCIRDGWSPNPAGLKCAGLFHTFRKLFFHVYKQGNCRLYVSTYTD